MKAHTILSLLLLAAGPFTASALNISSCIYCIEEKLTWDKDKKICAADVNEIKTVESCLWNLQLLSNASLTHNFAVTDDNVN